MMLFEDYFEYDECVTVSMVKIVDNYTLTDYLGKGQYGKVYKAFHIDTRIEVAVKMVSIDKFIEIGKLAELTRNEIQTLKQLEDNLNVVKFVEMIKTNNYIYLVYEFCEGGTLQDIIKQKGHLSEQEALKIFKQLINALKSLHENFILHRDIKPNNIFFKSSHLKLADFGFCKKLRSADDFTQTSLGSPLYMAPQIMNGDVYGSKADIWSCGVVLFEMLFGYCPYGHCNISQMLDIYNSDKGSITIPSHKYSISAVTQMMLRRMLEKDQFRRISWQDFFYEYDISSHGTIHKKEKDFQYDLMKLMKKNSTLSNSLKKKKSTAIKVDWAKITEKNSSVHSQQLGGGVEGSNQGELNEFLMLKRKIKEFQNQHTKMLEITLILESMLDSQKDYQYSNSIIFFLAHTLSSLVSENLAKIDQYILTQRDLLANSAAEANSLNKLQVVFKNQSNTVTAKANSIKVTLMKCQTLSKQIFKYPQKQVIRKFLKEYIDSYEQGSKDSTSLSHGGNREDTLFILRVAWAVGLSYSVQQQSSEKDKQRTKDSKELLSIKPETSKFELSVLLNKLLVLMGV